MEVFSKIHWFLRKEKYHRETVPSTKSIHQRALFLHKKTTIEKFRKLVDVIEHI